MVCIIPIYDSTIANHPLDKGNLLGWCVDSFPYAHISYSESVEDLPPDENLRGFNVDVHTEEERNEALGILDQILTLPGEDGDGDDDDDDDRTSVFFIYHSPVISLNKLLEI